MDILTEAHVEGGWRVTIDITADNFLELPPEICSLLHRTSNCSETLALLSYVAVILDRKRLEFDGALREATLTRRITQGGIDHNERVNDQRFDEGFRKLLMESQRKADRCPSRACRNDRRCMRGTLNPALCRSTADVFEKDPRDEAKPVKGQFIPDHGDDWTADADPKSPTGQHAIELAREVGDDNAFAGETDKRQGERRGKIGNRRQQFLVYEGDDRRTRLYGRREGNDRRVPDVGNQ